MVDNNITLESVRILFPNFSGVAGQFNAQGNRNFCVILEDRQLVKKLEEDGWNVRYLRPIDPEDDPQPYLQVKVGFPKPGSKSRPPLIVMITSRGQTKLDEDTISLLDTAEIANVDMILRPYNWEVQGRRGVKAYLKTMYVTLVEDELEKKYHMTETSAISGMMENDDGTLPF